MNAICNSTFQFAVNIVPAATRDMKGLDVAIRYALKCKIKSLRRNPRPPGVVKTKVAALWRVRVRDYRVIYEILDCKTTIHILGVLNRDESYDDLTDLNKRKR